MNAKHIAIVAVIAVVAVIVAKKLPVTGPLLA